MKRDPKHHRYWFPLTGNTVFLYANTTRTPFSDVRVRKAISMAIDRKLLVDVAAYGHSRPSDASGQSDAWPEWKVPPSPLTPGASSWTWYSPDLARTALRDAGVEGLEAEILVVAGWSDWVRAAQVVARGLRDVGIDARVRALDFSPWFEALQKGDFSLAIAWSEEGATPYRFYRSMMSPATVKPVGTIAPTNWHRFGDEQAGRLLAEFESTPDRSVRGRLMASLQGTFEALAPAIPLYPNPVWGTYSTKRARGFPSHDNPYASASPNREPECLLVLTALEPAE